MHETKAERLFRLTSSQIVTVIDEGHTPELERYIGLLHLALTYISEKDRPELTAEIAKLIRKCHSVGTGNPHEPIVSDRPVAIVCSYPRSGTTVAQTTTARALHAQLLTALPNGQFPFNKTIYPKTYPFIRLVKDHVARPIYENDRVAFVIRDGRDCMVSLAYMSRDRHGFTKRSDLAEFIRWLDEKYPFGGWAKFMKDMSNLLRAGNKHVMRYEDFMVSSAALSELIGFIDPDHRVSKELVQEAYDGSDEVFETLKAVASWGIGAEFDPDSLFYDWSLNRKGSTWSQTWDSKARKAFHETGATDFLIEYGYEKDPLWWT